MDAPRPAGFGRRALARLALALAAGATLAAQADASHTIDVACVSVRNAGGGMRTTCALRPELRPGERVTAASATLTAAGATPAHWTAPSDMLRDVPLVAEFTHAAGDVRGHAEVHTSARRTLREAFTPSVALTPAAGGLQVSPLALGQLDARGRFVPVSSLDAATGASQTLVSFELYGGRADMAVSIALEAAATPDGPAIMRLRPAVAATPEPDRFIVTAPVDAATVPVEATLLRAIVGIDGQPATRIIRRLRR